MNLKNLSLSIIASLCIFNCSNDEETDGIVGPTTIEAPDDTSGGNTTDPTETYADINFSNWKVTLPIDENNDGKPDEYQPSQLINNGYRSNLAIQPFMYDDTEDASIEFYTYPGTSTTNSSYSRTELRELINPSNARDNWTLAEGGEMTGRLKVVDISEDNETSRDYHRTIVMQIHGIISEEDMNAYGFSGNNGPPLIKITWIDGYLWSYKKSLEDESTDGDALYDVYGDVWSDEKVNLGYVGFDEFDFRITAADAKIEVQLNDETPYVYEDISLEKWPFENYFKAGNYLGTTVESAFSYVKYYNLNITH